MLNFTAMIQGIDTIFTNFIFIPALFNPVPEVSS